jgi:hypothetical protein
MTAGVALSVQRLGYVLADRGSIPGRGNDGIFSLRHRVQTGSEAHSASYSVVTTGSFPGGNAAGA